MNVHPHLPSKKGSTMHRFATLRALVEWLTWSPPANDEPPVCERHDWSPRSYRGAPRPRASMCPRCQLAAEIRHV